MRTILELCGAGTPEEALGEADKHRPSPLHSLRLLEALVERAPSVTVDLIVACGGDLSLLRRELARA